MTFRLQLSLMLFALGTFGGVARAQSPSWADQRLPANDGLLLWLDAASIPDAREAAQLPPVQEGAAFDRWPDASGNGRDFDQPITVDQPTLVRTGDAWSVRFDGETDFMRCVRVPATTREATLFVVAAPHENPGDYRGLFAASARNRRDYQSGLNVDLGSSPTARFERLNVEGLGFGGERDLLAEVAPFGTLHTIEVVVDPAQQSVRLNFDGTDTGTRPYSASDLSLDHLTLGARYFNNGAGEQNAHGPIQADIVEVLLYDHALTREASDAVRAYLDKKHRQLAVELPLELRLQKDGIPLVKAENPAAVQMLMAGFSVRELPLSLPNVNNVRYRDDGRLVTLGYNGDLHVLSDTDGDGLEDHAELFWKNEGSLRGPIGLLLTPPNYPKGRGAFVPSKGKLSLIVDTDGDDKADEEIVVASGWQEIPQNVDAVGIAMDKDGALYFGLGTANYADAYLIDDSGTAQYDLQSDRGTVQRVSSDFSKRETVCTGIRFPIAFAFNQHGDLFCSEQEGATWLANGNPFDELLHIRPGRHYGFPPRHPRHNPGVIDEPATFDYGPQHQSTCGMVFNGSLAGGPVFGPDRWRHDAIVCGESRGKLWRTKLIKTDNGYVAASQLLACLQMLTVDACVSPDGDLIVACHSGPPDWGTGPTGIGKLFRVRMSDAKAPRPVATWAHSANEIRIAFDQPLDPVSLRHLTEKVRVEYGSFVRAGDRFENLVPPYAVVQRQSMTPRYGLPVASASVTPDLRTLVISTAAMQANVHYSVTLPRDELDETGHANPITATDPLAQHGQTDVDFSLHGIHATWEPAGDATNAPSQGEGWSGWLPHLDLQVSRELTAGSAEHAKLWTDIEQPGTLTLRTRLDVQDVLRPAVQPGSTLDYQWPSETVTVVLSSPHGMDVAGPNVAMERQELATGGTQTRLTCDADADRLVDVTVTLRNDGGARPELTANVFTNEDARLRPLPISRFYPPWVRSKQAAAGDDLAPRQIVEIKGGNWGRGRRIFHSQAAGCFKCHALGSVGAKIGPDLSNLVHRDYDSVMRDIVHPSFSINPDYIGHTVLLDGGQVLTGVLRSESGTLLLGDAEGKVTRIDQQTIDVMKPANVSVMPKDLLQKLSTDQVRDLMTFLLTDPPHMPLDAPLEAPPMRTHAELAAVLAGSTTATDPPKSLDIVLVAGKKDHGPGEHDYPAWQIQWGQLLAAAPQVNVSAAWEFPDDQQMASADVLVFFQKGAWDDDRQAKIDAFLARGGGAVYVHWAVNGDERVADFSQRIGLASRGSSIRYRHGPLSLNIHNTDHPIVRNFDTLQLYDESYWLLTGSVDDVTLLASSVEDGQSQPQMWTYEKGPGRVFVSIPGHYSWTFDDPLFRVLLLRGIAWTGKQPIDRFNELAPLGARMTK